MKAGFHRVLRNKNPLRHRVREKIGSKTHSAMEGSVMRCHRCKGMMVYEKFYGDCEFFYGWRCVVCGEIIDQVILENRLDNIQ